KDLVVRAASQDPIPERSVLHAKKATAAAIEAGAEVGMIVSVQVSRSMKPNLVQHPGEVNDTTRPVEGAMRDGCLGCLLHGFSSTETTPWIFSATRKHYRILG